MDSSDGLKKGVNVDVKKYRNFSISAWEKEQKKKRCANCSFWAPVKKTKIRATWGVCLAFDNTCSKKNPWNIDYQTKWTNTYCRVFSQVKQVEVNGVIYRKELRFKRG